MSVQVAKRGSSSVWQRPLFTWAAALGLLAVLVAAAAWLAPRIPQWVGHGLSHAAVGVPLALVAISAVRRWPPARTTRPGRLGRRVLLIGLAAVVTGQLFEVLGARTDEPNALALEDLAHTVGMVCSMLGVPTTLAGGVLSLVAATRERAVPVWVTAIVGLAGLGLVTMMLVGAPDA
jgi:hypothetical protein